jgi:nitrosocyanin
MDGDTTNTTPERRFNPLWVVGGLVVIAVVIFLVLQNRGAGDADDMSGMDMEDTTVSVPGANTPVAVPSGMKMIAVEGGSFYFQPNEIRVKKGDRVKVVLASKDMVHDFVVDELGIRTPIIKAGETGEVEFTADKTGTFEYYCSVGQHRANGMVGKLIVEE